MCYQAVLSRMGRDVKGRVKDSPYLTSIVSLWKGENLYGALN